MVPSIINMLSGSSILQLYFIAFILGGPLGSSIPWHLTISKPSTLCNSSKYKSCTRVCEQTSEVCGDSRKLLRFVCEFLYVGSLFVEMLFKCDNFITYQLGRGHAMCCNPVAQCHHSKRCLWCRSQFLRQNIHQPCERLWHIARPTNRDDHHAPLSELEIEFWPGPSQ